MTVETYRVPILGKMTFRTAVCCERKPVFEQHKFPTEFRSERNWNPAGKVCVPRRKTRSKSQLCLGLLCAYVYHKQTPHTHQSTSLTQSKQSNSRRGKLLLLLLSMNVPPVCVFVLLLHRLMLPSNSNQPQQQQQQRINSVCSSP